MRPLDEFPAYSRGKWHTDWAEDAIWAMAHLNSLEAESPANGESSGKVIVEDYPPCPDAFNAGESISIVKVGDREDIVITCKADITNEDHSSKE